MPDLLNLLVHMKNKAVLVNGTRYEIDQDGIARNVAEQDAGKLLQNKAWMNFDPEAIKEREERQKAIREEFKQSGIQLITRKGELIDPRKVNEAEDKKRAEVESEDFPSMRSEGSQPEPKLEPEPKPEPEPEPESEPESEPVGPDLAGPDVDPQQTDDEWPDPHMGMKKPFLQNMANAYGLPYTHQTKKQELVDMIMRAMYDET
jgi:hypothetical protein